MIPGSFIFRRLGNDWLCGDVAATLFGAAALITLVLTVVMGGPVPEAPGLLANVFLGILGVAGAVSILFLWTGMWRYWSEIDASGKSVKTIWFVVLLFGIWYGAIVYYLFAYLGSRRRRRSSTISSPLRVGVFGYVLVAGWCAFFVFVALLFAFPNWMAHFLGPVADFIVLIPVTLLISTVLYRLMRIYRSGIRRSPIEDEPVTRH